MVGGNAVLLEQAGLAGGLARGAVRLHPAIAPFVGRAPAVRVEMEGSKVDGGDGEVAREVAAFDVGVGIAAVGEEVESKALYFYQYLLMERCYMVTRETNHRQCKPYASYPTS